MSTEAFVEGCAYVDFVNESCHEVETCKSNMGHHVPPSTRNESCHEEESCKSNVGPLNERKLMQYMHK